MTFNAYILKFTTDFGCQILHSKEVWFSEGGCIALFENQAPVMSLKLGTQKSLFTFAFIAYFVSYIISKIKA